MPKVSQQAKQDAYDVAVANVVDIVLEGAEEGMTNDALIYAARWAEIAMALKPRVVVDVLR